MSTTGFVLPAISLGLGAISIKPNTRGILPNASARLIIPQAAIEEVHHDELMITDHPVERGSNISDHAYKLPAEVIIRYGFSNSPSTNQGGVISSAVTQALNISTSLNPIAGIISQAEGTIDAIGSLLSGNSVSQIDAIYDNLRKIQASCIPFSVYTGKRVYENMLFKSLSVTTNLESENSLMLVATCRQVIIVNTQTVTVPINSSAQALPQSTTPTQKLGSKSLLNASGQYINE